MYCGNWSTTCCPFKDEFQENKLNEEIDWGISIRKNRFQEREIILQEEPSELFAAKKKAKHKKKKKCMKALIDKCTCVKKKIPLCRKLSEKFELIKRDTLTYHQYINFLAHPKIQFCPEPPEKPVSRKKPAKVCSPRCTQLALPLKRRIFYSWKDYYHILSPEQITFLKDLLNKEEALLPLDAYKYFQRLNREQRKLKKLKKKKEKEKILSKPKKSKIIREINCLSKLIVDFFANKMLQTVKCSHMFLTNIMKTKLEENHLIKPGYRRDKPNDICGKTLYDTLDQVSVWLESNIGFGDEESELGSESVSSITYSDIEREFEYQEIGEEEFMEEEEPMLLWKEESIREEGEEILEKIPEEEEQEPEVLIEEEISEEKEEAEAEVEVEEEVQAEEVIEEIEAEETVPVDLASVAVDELSMQGEEPVERKIEKPTSDTALESVADILNELIMNATQERALKIEDHSPDAVCCVTLKTWATWLVDVAQNTHSWCQWIQEVIARVRFFAAILRGEVKTKDGKTRILYKEEWQQFTETLAQDIEAWQKYKSHVKELSDQIIEGFQNKRVICCQACLKSKLIISAETAHQVTEQLVEALNTTAYWRGWLDAIVDEAKKLACLQFDLPSAQAIDTSSSSYESSTSYIIEIIEIKSPSTKSGSDTSMFVLEELKDKESKDSKDQDADST